MRIFFCSCLIVNTLGTLAAYCLFPKSRVSMYKGLLTRNLLYSGFVELTLINILAFAEVSGCG